MERAKVALKARTRQASGARSAVVALEGIISDTEPGEAPSVATARELVAADTRGPCSQVEACQSTTCA